MSDGDGGSDHSRRPQRYEKLVWTPEMVAAFWDWRSSQPDDYFACRHGGALLGVLKAHLPKGARVLDYGCGPGALVGRLLARGYRAAGADRSRASRDEVVRRSSGEPAFDGVFAPEEVAPLGPRFDAVTLLEVVEHLYDDSLDELLSTLRDALVPGGLLFVTTPNEEDLESAMVLCPATRKLFHPWQHVRSWSAEALARHLDGLGFQTIECRPTHFGTSFDTAGSPHPWRSRAGALRRRLRRWVHAHDEGPHLYALARRPEAVA